MELDILKREMLTRESEDGKKRGKEADELAASLESLGEEKRELEARSYDEALVGALAAKCTAEESGARKIDFILTQTLLPEVSGRILERMARGENFERVHISLDEMGRFV